MAVSSGSFATNSVEGRSVTFSWSIKETSIANNTTTINWSLKSSGSFSGYVASRKFKVVIDGQQVYYSSADINLYNNQTIATGTHTIKHNDLGKKSFSASVECAIFYFAVSAWGNGSWELPDIPRQATIVSAPNFNDEQNPTITYSNPAGNNVTTLRACISFDGSKDDISYRAIPKTGTSYTFNLTDAERNVLRNATTTSNSKTVIFFIETVIGGTTLRHTASKTLTITNATPTVGTFSYKDNNATTTAITGNNQRIIRNNSVLLFTLGTATAKKGATITKYQVTVSGVSKEVGTAGDVRWGVLNLSSNTTATLKVTDSRGNTATKQLTVTIDDWKLPTALISAVRKNNFYSETYIKADSTYSSLNGKNAITITCQYKKVSDSSYTSVALTNNTQKTLNLDNNYKWNLSVTVKDKIGSTTYNLILDRGMPIIFFDRLKSSVGINCFPTTQDAVEVDGVLKHNNSYVHSLKAGQGTQGYIKFAEITIKYAYINQPIEFKIARRQSYLYTTLSMMFASTDSLDPSLQGFETRWWNIPIYAIKTSESHWSLYIQKAEAYDDITIANFTKGSYLSQVDVKLTNEFVSTLPSGTVQAQYYQVPMHKTLYENANGTTGTITLSDSVANFTYLEIYYMDNLKADVQSIKVPSPNNKIVTCACIEPSESERLYIRASRYTLVGTAMTHVRGTLGTLQNGSNPTIAMTPYIHVIKVVGYR